MNHKLLLLLIAMWLLPAVIIRAQPPVTLTDICPGSGIQPRPAEFEPGGILLVPFDKNSMWVYNINADTRYPLPETQPCTGNCHLSPDGRWLSYLNPDTFGFFRMRLDGTGRTSLAPGAGDVQWWNDTLLLVWTPEYRVYLRPVDDLNAERIYLPAEGVLAIQPGGYQALAMVQDENGLQRYMVDLAARYNNDPPRRVYLAPDRAYFNAGAWSPDGGYLAYVGDGVFDEETGIRGGELYLIAPDSDTPRQMTDFSADYGAVRINGFDPNRLSWSPDGNWLAFWVMELTGSDPATNSGQAVLHTLNVESGEIRRYCGFATDNHTPNPPRLVWSPDSSHVAFAGDVPNDNKGALLLALNIESGVFTELSNGVYPALGQPNVIAWGRAP
jgi:Tol biopolymer transport system component